MPARRARKASEGTFLESVLDRLGRIELMIQLLIHQPELPGDDTLLQDAGEKKFGRPFMPPPGLSLVMRHASATREDAITGDLHREATEKQRDAAISIQRVWRAYCQRPEATAASGDEEEEMVFTKEQVEIIIQDMNRRFQVLIEEKFDASRKDNDQAAKETIDDPVKRAQLEPNFDHVTGEAETEAQFEEELDAWSDNDEENEQFHAYTAEWNHKGRNCQCQTCSNAGLLVSNSNSSDAGMELLELRKQTQAMKEKGPRKAKKGHAARNAKRHVVEWKMNKYRAISLNAIAKRRIGQR